MFCLKCIFNLIKLILLSKSRFLGKKLLPSYYCYFVPKLHHRTFWRQSSILWPYITVNIMSIIGSGDMEWKIDSILRLLQRVNEPASLFHIHSQRLHAHPSIRIITSISNYPSVTSVLLLLLLLLYTEQCDYLKRENLYLSYSEINSFWLEPPSPFILCCLSKLQFLLFLCVPLSDAEDLLQDRVTRRQRWWWWDD